MILLTVSAIEVFISFLQGFVYLILLKIYSDDSLNVVGTKVSIKRDVLAYKDILNKVLKRVSSLYLATETKEKKKTTKKTAKVETPKKVTKKSTVNKIVVEEKPTKDNHNTEELDFNPLPIEDLKSGKYNLKFDHTKNPVSKRKTNPREDYGIISRVDGGIIYITGLYNLSVGEIVYFGRNMEQAITLNLERNIAKAAIFSSNDNVAQGTPVFRTFRLMKVNICPQLLGNVIDCLGNSLSGSDIISNNDVIISRTVDVKALGVIDRKSINEPLVTGVLSIDAMLPIGRGQRELIIGDRQLGKTSLAIDSIISQKNLHISE